MGYKQIGENLSFADVAVAKSLENNRKPQDDGEDKQGC